MVPSLASTGPRPTFFTYCPRGLFVAAPEACRRVGATAYGAGGMSGPPHVGARVRFQFSCNSPCDVGFRYRRVEIGELPEPKRPRKSQENVEQDLEDKDEACDEDATTRGMPNHVQTDAIAAHMPCIRSSPLEDVLDGRPTSSHHLLRPARPRRMASWRGLNTSLESSGPMARRKAHGDPREPFKRRRLTVGTDFVIVVGSTSGSSFLVFLFAIIVVRKVIAVAVVVVLIVVVCRRRHCRFRHRRCCRRLPRRRRRRRQR